MLCENRILYLLFIIHKLDNQWLNIIYTIILFKIILHFKEIIFTNKH